MSNTESSVVARFPDLDSANKALRSLRHAQQNRGLAISEGAVVIGTADGIMPVVELDDIGLSDVASNALELATFLGIGTVKIAAGAAISGGLLLLSSGRKAAALGGSLLLMPAKWAMDMLEADKTIDYFDATIEPGACAVVAVVDEPELIAQVVAELAEAGGEVVDLELDGGVIA
jgi:hypothetical protein